MRALLNFLLGTLNPQREPQMPLSLPVNENKNAWSRWGKAALIQPMTLGYPPHFHKTACRLGGQEEADQLRDFGKKKKSTSGILSINPGGASSTFLHLHKYDVKQLS